MLPGHEAAGIVEGLGPDIDDVELRKRIMFTFLARCRECPACASDGRVPCVNGSASNDAGTLLSGSIRLHVAGQDVRHHLGVSGFAIHVVVDRRSVVVVYSEVPAAIAAMLCCAVLIGGGAVISVGRLRTGDTVGLVGLGGVGMAAILTALAHDGVRVIAIDVRAENLAGAGELGAHEAYLPEAAREAKLRTDLVIEAMGLARAFEDAFSFTAPSGRMVSVGLARADDLAKISPLELAAGSRSIIGSSLGSSVASRVIPLFVALWRAGRLPLEKLMSAEIRLPDINQAMDYLADGNAIRQLINFDAAAAGESASTDVS